MLTKEQKLELKKLGNVHFVDCPNFYFNVNQLRPVRDTDANSDFTVSAVSMVNRFETFEQLIKKVIQSEIVCIVENKDFDLEPIEGKMLVRMIEMPTRWDMKGFIKPKELTIEERLKNLEGKVASLENRTESIYTGSRTNY